MPFLDLLFDMLFRNKGHVSLHGLFTICTTILVCFVVFFLLKCVFYFIFFPQPTRKSLRATYSTCSVPPPLPPPFHPEPFTKLIIARVFGMGLPFSLSLFLPSSSHMETAAQMKRRPRNQWVVVGRPFPN